MNTSVRKDRFVDQNPAVPSLVVVARQPHEPFAKVDQQDAEIERSFRDLDLKIAMLRQEALALSYERMPRSQRPKT